MRFILCIELDLWIIDINFTFLYYNVCAVGIPEY